MRIQFIKLWETIFFLVVVRFFNVLGVIRRTDTVGLLETSYFSEC